MAGRSHRETFNRDVSSRSHRIGSRTSIFHETTNTTSHSGMEIYQQEQTQHNLKALWTKALPIYSWTLAFLIFVEVS